MLEKESARWKSNLFRFSNLFNPASRRGFLTFKKNIMSQQNRETLKTYFETGDKPTQEQFEELIDSYWHKSDEIKISDISKLEETIENQTLQQAIDNSLPDDDGKIIVQHNNPIVFETPGDDGGIELNPYFISSKLGDHTTYISGEEGGLYTKTSLSNASYTANGISFNTNSPEEEFDFLISDSTPEQRGLQYAGDYSNGYTDRSLVDKEYVDRTISNDASNQWVWDGTNGNMTIKEASGLGNTGQALFAVGNEAGANNSGYGTTAIGYQALKNQTTNFNIGIGTQAGQNNTGAQGLFLGNLAGQNNSGTDIIAIGSEAARGYKAQSAADGHNMIIIGRKAYATPSVSGMSVWHGGNSVIIGDEAGKNIQCSYQDVYLGHGAGMNAGTMATANNTYSGQNIGIGYTALRGIVGTNNIGLGGGGGPSAPGGAGREAKGNDNILVGRRAGISLIGNANILMGINQGEATQGNNNIAIHGGSQMFNNAGTNTATAIGTHFGSTVRVPSNSISLGYNGFIYGNGTTQNLGIGLGMTSNVPNAPRERLDLGDNGSMIAKSVKMKSPNGKLWEIQVNDSGQLTTTEIV